MEADFTLVPNGGLGNRINAICSAVSYCKQKNKSLKILWFKDKGLNCSFKELFYINPAIKNVKMDDAGFLDLILRDNPRKRNLWIPQIFQYFLYDRRIYIPEVYQAMVTGKKPFFGGIDDYEHLFMVSYWRFWTEKEMWKYIVIAPHIKNKADDIVKKFIK